MDLGKLTTKKLFALLEHSNVWQRRIAQRLLRERRDAAAKPELLELLEKGKTLESRLAALWTLHSSEQLDEATLDKFVADKEPSVRAWVGRLTGERQTVLPVTIARLEQLAADAEPSVRLAAIVAARQFVSGALTVNQPGVATPQDFDNLGAVIVAAIQNSADGRDPLIPFMLWMAAEPMVAQDAQAALNWMLENGAATMPLSGKLVGKVMRRLCDTGESTKLDPVVEFLAAAAERAPQLALAALDGLLEGQKARPLLPAVSATALFEKLNASSDAKLRERSQQLAALWGDAAAIGRIFASVQDTNAKLDERIKAVQTLGQLKSDAAREGLLKFLPVAKVEPLLIETVRALGQTGGDDVGDQLIASWKTFSPAVRREVVDVLVSRRRWAASLFTAVEAKTISPTELSATAIRALVESNDEAIRRRAAQSIGRIRPTNADKQAIIAAKKKMITAEGAPDLQAGHELTKKTCLVCHKFYGEGGEVGPDLTGVGRSTLDALLANVIDPNQVVGKGYESVDIETKDGREVSGRLVEDTPSHVKLLASGPKEEIVAKDNIAKQRVSELSVMPEGLEQMPDADFRNLILYILNPPQGQ
jgi:putative heme-binding domain-containing protein